MKFEQAQKVIDKNVSLFLNDIKRMCAKPIRVNFHDTKLGIFRPASSDYFVSQHFEVNSEKKIQNHFIQNTITELLNYIDAKVEVLNTNNCFSSERYSHKEFLSFIIEYEERRIDYQSFYLELDDKQAGELLKQLQLNQICIIDWNKEDFEHQDLGRKHVFNISSSTFFKYYFSDEVYDYYLHQIKDAVQQANFLIGFQTTPDLTLRYLSIFKSKTLEMLRNFNLKEQQYQEFGENGKSLLRIVCPVGKNEYYSFYYEYFLRF